MRTDVAVQCADALEQTPSKESKAMIYRRYMADDFAALYSIEERCFESRFRFGKGYMQHLIGSGESATWIAEEDGQMVAFAIVGWGTNSRQGGGYLQTVEVLSDYRGRGVAAKLIALAETSARLANAQEMWLHVDVENDAAIRLYEKCGYRRRGRKEHFYARGRSALVYGKPLESAKELSRMHVAVGYSAA